MRSAETDSDKTLLEPLTRREGQMLVLLAEGYSRPEIATKLTLALTSVKFHIQHLYGKLGVNSKRQALSRAKELGLLAPPPPATLAAGPGGQAAQPAPHHNLPMQVTRFFGREGEIAQLRDRLDDNRLVTLTGSGGVGKTRLSLRVAEEALGEFNDGVWFVELASLSDPELVPRQAAFSFGLRDELGRSSLETLTGFLRQRQALLVLDNCEHLPEACARLADSLLRACPALQILASSREPLGADGEAVFRVPSLPFPDPAQALSPERLSEFASVRLFIDRARLVLPDYQVADHNAAPVASICQRLDGIPLAIEMAAARLNILTAEQLADRLDDVFRLLTGGSRSALPRQQTLRATVDWSYKLLSDKERLLFQRLAVFAGGCTLEAAEAVCADPSRDVSLPPADVLDLLGSLVAKSIVIADRRSGEETRYHMLEMVRQYAREKLQDSGESVPLHTRHRDYFLMFVETNVAKRDFWDRLIPTRRLEAERENLRRALEWSFSELTGVEAGPRLLDAMAYDWTSHQEYMDWLKKGVAWCQSHSEISDRVYASLLGRASLPLAQNDPQTALTWVRQAVDISRRLAPDGREILMRNLLRLGRLLLEERGDVAPALAPLAEAEAIFLEVGPDRFPPEKYLVTKAGFATMKAVSGNGQGHYQDAKMQASESIRLFEESGDRWGSIQPQIELGTACHNLGEYEQARDHFLKALSLIEESGDYRKAFVIRWLGIVDFWQGNLGRALEYCRESLKEAVKAPDYNIIASCLGLSASIAAKQGQPARAARMSGAAQALYAKQHRNAWEDSSLDTLLRGWREGPDQASILIAFEAGKAMQPEQMVAYALGDEVV